MHRGKRAIRAREIPVGRPIKLDGMAYGPTNEQGVVYLFGRLAPRLGFHVEAVQSSFPDCIARRSGKKYRIEFEYRASSYQNHPPRGADIIVCWENDWEHRPRQYRHLEIIDLKRYTGATPRVFVVGCDETLHGDVGHRYATIGWSVPSNAQVGDLIVMYRKKPASQIRDLWVVRGPFYTIRYWGLQAKLKRLARLYRPVTFAELKSDPATRNLPVIRSKFQGKKDITTEWPNIRAVILKRNPRLMKVLRRFSFD